MTHQPQLIPDQPTPEQAARDAERAEYLERLREKLKDPEFRAIEGFPIGEDEDILALSDPPYYTACPNPFLPEILERWQAERAQTREELGLPDDSDDSSDSGRPVYRREPFAADVSEGKRGAIYTAHGYHTKVPHKAVMRYILHYTDPGDIVFDGFCGTGMTGVAAQLCGDRKQLESLGYRVRDDGAVLGERGQIISRLGTRKAVLADLSPVATFIAYNYNTPVDVVGFERHAKRILREVEQEYGWMYGTLHVDEKTTGRINFTVWSDVFTCPECTKEIVFVDEALNKETGSIRKSFPCPHCGALSTKKDLNLLYETAYDQVLGKTVSLPKRVPVLINYKTKGQKYEKKPDLRDLEVLTRIATMSLPDVVPTAELPDMQMRRVGRMQPAHISHIHHFFLPRAAHGLAELWSQAASFQTRRLRNMLVFFVEQAIWGMSVLNRYSPSHYSQVNRALSGVFYVASQISEVSPWYNLEGKLSRLVKAFAEATTSTSSSGITTENLATANIEDNSIDYIFTDPPFGENIYYSDLNVLIESWHKVTTAPETEAIVDRVKGKTLLDYQQMMQECFRNYYRVLKPGRWMTVEFHNSRNSVWNAIQEALQVGGFIVADVRTLDKKQGSFQQVVSGGAVKQDLVISAYRPRIGFERRFLEGAGSTEGAWTFVRQHLAQLPVVVKQDGVLEVVAERQAYLLYDRMVAFHIQRGFSVPMGAAEFYAGLKQRFPERDEMYFLPDQVAEYDRERMRATKVEQLALFVTDEKSAIQWLRRELHPETGAGPQTYQNLQPKFLRELHQARHEDLPELSEMLAQSFLKDERERWYVPDPGRQGDLEKLRERSLLREFSEYAQGRGRLKVFRTEAVRAGFKHAWHERDYNLIVKVAERLPPSVLQEDASLLMYYDNAMMRAEAQPEQGRLL